jgi:hypothetical protein
LPPRPFDGGTPTSRVGGVDALAAVAASSDWMMDSTSSMHISTFSGFRSRGGEPFSETGAKKGARRTSVDDAATPVHVIEA